MTFPKPPSNDPRPPPGFLRIEGARAPHYEVWYGKVDLAPGRAFWFRYTITDGRTGEAAAWAGSEAAVGANREAAAWASREAAVWASCEAAVWASREAAVWAILFDGGRVLTGKNRFRMEHLEPSPLFMAGESRLESARARGRAGSIAWDLTWRDSGRRFVHVPRILRRLGIAKTSYEASYLDVAMDGWVSTGPERIPVRGATGMLGHIEGSRSAHSWAWSHANRFDGGEDAAFEGLSARIPLLGRPSRPLSSFVLCLGQRVHAFRSARTLLAARSRFGGGTWSFAAHEGGTSIEGDACSPGSVALVEYTDTDGSKLWCENSKLSDLRVRFTDRGRGVDVRLQATGTAAFELVGRDPPARAVDL